MCNSDLNYYRPPSAQWECFNCLFIVLSITNLLWCHDCTNYCNCDLNYCRPPSGCTINVSVLTVCLLSCQ